MTERAVLALTLSGLAILTLTGAEGAGQAVPDRDGPYIVNDLAAAQAAARRTGKPIFVVFRCERWLDCERFDAQVVRQDKDILALADRFVCLRIVRLNGVDLNLFRYDYDLTWMSFFVSADNRIYARYGGRTPTDPEGRVSKEGLLHTMNEVLKLHQQETANPSPPPTALPPRRPEEMTMFRNTVGNARNFCIRCHLVNEAFNLEATLAKQTNKELRQESYFSFPPPEVLGIKPNRVRGNQVEEVTPGSPADRAGLKKGDLLRTVKGLPVLTCFDIQHALNEVQTERTLAVTAERDGVKQSFQLQLPADWRRWDTSWRKSLINAQPTLGFNGDELSAAEKAERKLPPEGLAYKVKFTLPSGAFAQAGIQSGDVIVALNGKRTIPYANFRGCIPLLANVGDRIELTYLREGKEQSAPLLWK